MVQITVPNEALKYVLFQRTGHLRFANKLIFRVLNRFLPFPIYNRIVEIEARIDPPRKKALYIEDLRKEYLSIRDHLPKTCSSILDIGCGVAGIDVFLSQHYGGQQPVFYLLDKTEIERSVYYGLRSRGAFYNSLDVAKEMLVSNGVSEKCVQLIEATATNEIDIDREVDLVISLISWGFHYPVEAYLERVYDILAEGGSIIMDVRKGADGLGMLENALSKVNVIADHGKFQRVLAIK